jgi:regulator of protease activity HflC (stomatin/prohibitin superfamily)
MMRFIQVALHERAVLLKNGLPIRPLAPGRHFALGFGLSALFFDVRHVVLDAPVEVRAAMPHEWFADIALEPHERALVRVDGKPKTWLRPGNHRIWQVDPAVTIEMFSVDGPVPTITPELRAVLPAGEIMELTILAHERGVLSVDGRFDRVVEPGRYAFWTPPEAPVEIARVDTRRREVAVNGQDLLTRDKVSLRLTLTADIAVIDPVLALRSVQSVDNAVYLAVQLAARALVSAMSLDELLEARELVSRTLSEAVAPQALGFGVEVRAVGIKDIVLPGEMKTLLNRVIEAEKAAAANVIHRREETAATRQLANTARLLADNPVLMRLRELEMLKDIAGQLKEVRLVVGADKLEALLPAGLVGSSDRQ